MDIWDELYERALEVRVERRISPFIIAGEVGAALQTKRGNIYTGVCLDTMSSLGFCAERNAVGSMLSAGENEIVRLVAVMPDGGTGAPCGACRELMMQLGCGDMEILMCKEPRRIVKLRELLPDWPFEKDAQ